MVNLTYAGTHFDNGKPPNDTACVTGFDQAGFVMGTSASLFNVRIVYSDQFQFSDLYYLANSGLCS